MRKYAIVKPLDRELGYWFTGKTYEHQGETYAVFEGRTKPEEAKTWQTRKAANNALVKLEERAANLWSGELSVVEIINQ